MYSSHPLSQYCVVHLPESEFCEICDSLRDLNTTRDITGKMLQMNRCRHAKEIHIIKSLRLRYMM